MSSVEAVQQDEPNAWWTTLKHEGVLLSPIVLEEIFPEGPPEIEEFEHAKLRRGYRQFRNDPDKLYDWLDLVFENLLGHHRSSWIKETHVPPEFRRGDVRPNRVLLDRNDDPRAMVVIDEDRVTTDEGDPGRIGIYSGKKTHADLVRLLRETGAELGILTNGHQFRVVHATLDHESWTEWEAGAWFQGGEGRRALRGFYGLLSDAELPSPLEDEEASLVGRIEVSRDRQADLSDVMGTQVREAVELLIRELDGILMEMTEEEREQVLSPLKELDLNRRDELRARYQASIRIVMRLVVSLYAESRELFPKDNPVYYDSYSVEGLFRELREARIEEGEDTLDQQFGAWQQLQALSRLVYYGSPHQDIPLRAYGGRLFRPPGEDGDDDVLAGLSVFEDDNVRISDATILAVLEKLKIAEFRSGGEQRTGPVDFSDLRTEYIGMMYEGLLDYELREATEDDGAILFLNIGDEPALPFNVLENLDDDGLENLVDNLKDSASDSFLTDEEVSEDDFEEDDSGGDVNGQGEETDEFSEIEDDLEARIHRWAKRVVEQTGVYMPHHNTVRAMDPTTREKYEMEAARRLIDRIIRPGGTYLVSFSGTRKSTGTFYTPPELAIPTVHRTLEPLAYEKIDDNSKVPKKPPEILNLQICDPAMGSGTFPVAALRYLTDALMESFEQYVLPEVSKGEPIVAPLGKSSKGYLNERLLDVRKGEEDDWQERLEAQLKRSVVESCIYGVDINPLAVELGKLSLWIETLDPKLPFTFLDHKIRVGNSLIGAWLDSFDHYPVAAWNRDGGNEGRTNRIEEFRNAELKDQMEKQINILQNQTHWFGEKGADAEELVYDARQVFEDIHETVSEDEREKLFQEEFQSHNGIQSLRLEMDRWCSVWFWPMDAEGTPTLDPDSFYSADDSEQVDEIVARLSERRRLRFFHWELEFPDVFTSDTPGFDALVGNPPWDAVKPDKVNFFTRYIPGYRAYGSEEKARAEERLLDEQPAIEGRLADYVGYFEGMKNFMDYSATPWELAHGRGKKKFNDKYKSFLNSDFAEGYSPDHPYELQVSNRNYYKLFAEQFLNLTNDSGRFGIITPHGIYADKNTKPIREQFLNQNSWEWLFGFENRKNIFDIHGQFKFSVSIVDSRSQTDTIKSRFMLRNVEKWNIREPEYLQYDFDQIKSFSPSNLSIIEFDNQRDLNISSKLYDNSKTLGEHVGKGVSGGREFLMTQDAHLRRDREKWLADGYEQMDNGKLKAPDGEEALPFYVGEMIHQFDFAFKAWNDGEMNELPPSGKRIDSQEYMDLQTFREEGLDPMDVRLAYRAVGSSTNERSLICALIPDYPAGHSIMMLKGMDEGLEKLALPGILNSFIFDYLLRQKVTSNISWYLLKELPIPELPKDDLVEISKLVAKLNWHPKYFPSLEEYTEGELSDIDFEESSEERAKIREELDKMVMDAYDITREEMKWIVRPSDDRRNLWRNYNKRLELLGGEGYWGSLREYDPVVGVIEGDT